MARLRSLPAALGLLSALAAAPQASAATPFQLRCEAGPPAAIALSAYEQGYRVDHSQSWRTLTRMKRPAGGGWVLGLTHAEYRIAISIEGRVEPDPDAPFECFAPRIAVSLSWQPIVVYVGREFREDGCAYREILAHELRHVAAYVGYLTIVEDKLRVGLPRRLGGLMADGRPVYAPAGQAMRQAQRELDRRWMPYIRREMAMAKLAQAAIDTPREYARLSKVCQGEVQSLIGSTRRSRS